MKTTVGIHQAKTHLSDLLRQVEKGSSVIITRRGEPVAELRRVSEPGLQESGSLQWELPDRSALIEILNTTSDTLKSFYSGE